MPSVFWFTQYVFEIRPNCSEINYDRFLRAGRLRRNKSGTAQVSAPLKGQKSNVFSICERTLLLNFHQFYSTKNTQKAAHKSRKPLSLHILKSRIFFFRKKPYSAENPNKSSMLAKRFVSGNNRGDLR